MFKWFRSFTGGPALPANARLYTLVSRVITPAVLLLGLLLLLAVHFNGVLKITQAQDDLYHNQKAYSNGPMQYTFQLDAGIDRPSVAYAGANVMRYVEWNSTIAVDGHVSNLWDNYHGYDYDHNNPNATQFFSTITGPSWQIVQVVTLVDAHTVTVAYSIVARAQGVAEPHHVVLTIEHMHASWYQPTITNNTFRAGVLGGAVSGSISSQDLPQPSGTVTLAVAGPAVPQHALVLENVQGTIDTSGASRSVATGLTTTYVIDNPQVNRLTPLGTETLTYTTATPTGTAIPSKHS